MSFYKKKNFERLEKKFTKVRYYFYFDIYNKSII